MMIKKRKSRQIFVGTVPVGGDAPVAVQSMTNTDTRDIDSTCSQIQIMPHPHSQYQNGANIALVDCQINIRYAAPGHLTVNPDEGCGCKTGPGVTPTPVFDTSWGQIKSLYVN